MSRPRRFVDHVSVTTKLPRAHVLALRRVALEQSNGQPILAADLIRRAVAEFIERHEADARAGLGELATFVQRGQLAQEAATAAVADAEAAIATTRSKPAPRARARKRGGRR